VSWESAEMSEDFFKFNGLEYKIFFNSFDIESYKNLIVFKDHRMSTGSNLGFTNVFIAPERFYNFSTNGLSIPKNFSCTKIFKGIYENHNGRKYEVIGGGIDITSKRELIVCKGLYDSPLRKNIILCIDKKFFDSSNKHESDEDIFMTRVI
jgi:hypothetical protein